MNSEKSVRIFDYHLKPKIHKNTKIYRVFKKKNGDIFAIGNPDLDKYLLIPNEAVDIFRFLIDNLDGTKSLEDIDKMLVKNFMKKVNVLDVVQLLYDNNLLESPKNNTVNEHKRSKNVIDIASFNIYDKITKRMAKILWYGIILLFSIFFPISISLIIYTVLECNISIVALLLKKGTYLDAFLIYFPFTLLLLYLHEFYHAIAGIYYGMKPKGIYFGLFLKVFPVFYVKFYEPYIFGENIRIKVALAGPIFNFTMFSILYTIGYLFSLDDLIIVATGGLIGGILLLLPFRFSDGYTILVNILKTPNILSRSINAAKKFIKNREVSTYLLYFLIFWLWLILSYISFFAWLYLIIIDLLIVNNYLKIMLFLIVINWNYILGFVLYLLASRRRQNDS